MGNAEKYQNTVACFGYAQWTRNSFSSITREISVEETHDESMQAIRKALTATSTASSLHLHPLNKNISLSNYNFSKEMENFYQYWALVLTLFPVVTLFGNGLVVVSVIREPTLHTVTNYFIVSLAVADISLALLVMPGSAWVEANNGRWKYGRTLCDIFIMLDIMLCTASILNLMAISLDRYVAVKYPIVYSKHNHNTRVVIMIAVTWTLSFIIALPITCGLNNMPYRQDEICVLYNAGYIIASSLGSFYLPCIVMIVLYYKVIQTICIKAKTARRTSSAKDLLKPTHRAHFRDSGLLESTRETDMNEPNESTSVENRCVDNSCAERDAKMNELHTTAKQITRPILIDYESKSSRSSRHSSTQGQQVYQFNSCLNRSIRGSEQFIKYGTSKSPVTKRRKTDTAMFSRETKCSSDLRIPRNSMRLSRSSIYLFLPGFLRDKTISKREKKVTKTLAIVLAVFLFCWMPFFTVNIIHALCFKLNRKTKDNVCEIPKIVDSAVTWLGYINSTVNPIIYTIFNAEFRKTFKKLMHCV